MSAFSGPGGSMAEHRERKRAEAAARNKETPRNRTAEYRRERVAKAEAKRAKKNRRNGGEGQ